MSFLTTLTLMFVVLKLVKVIQWSWWLVLSPIWGFYLFVTLMTLIILACGGKATCTAKFPVKIVR